MFINGCMINPNDTQSNTQSNATNRILETNIEKIMYSYGLIIATGFTPQELTTIKKNELVKILEDSLTYVFTKNKSDILYYESGLKIAKKLKQDGQIQNNNDINIAKNIFKDALTDVSEGNELKISDEEFKNIIDKFYKSSTPCFFYYDPNAPILGNPNGNILITAFFDYNCSYSKKSFKSIIELIKTNKNIKIVIRELPILGDDSIYAAKAALASKMQNKYEEFQKKLMDNPKNDNESVIKIANDLNIDISLLKEDMNSIYVKNHIKYSQEISQKLNILGVPAFIHNNEIIPGAISLEKMKELVNK